MEKYKTANVSVAAPSPTYASYSFNEYVAQNATVNRSFNPGKKIIAGGITSAVGTYGKYNCSVSYSGTTLSMSVTNTHSGQQRISISMRAYYFA